MYGIISQRCGAFALCSYFLDSPKSPSPFQSKRVLLRPFVPLITKAQQQIISSHIRAVLLLSEIHTNISTILLLRNVHLMFHFPSSSYPHIFCRRSVTNLSHRIALPPLPRSQHARTMVWRTREATQKNEYPRAILNSNTLSDNRSVHLRFNNPASTLLCYHQD